MIARFWAAKHDPGGFSSAPALSGDPWARASSSANVVKLEPPRRARGYMVEAVGADHISGFIESWEDLHDRALEANVFLDPAFAIAACQHLPAIRRPVFVLVHEERAPQQRGRLVGVTPITLPKRNFGDSIARGFEHKFAALGMPLYDRHQGAHALELTLEWLAEERPDIVGLLLSDLPRGGPVFSLLRRHATRLGRKLAVFDERERAVLIGGKSGEAFSAQGGKLKEARRLRRQMERLGNLTYRSLRSPADIRKGAELFMALEDSGWKGARGTSLLADPSVTTFARTMTRLMARKGKISIESLEIDGKPAAMGVVLESDSRAYFWKIAYDESLARYSPGVQLTLELSRRLAARPEIVLADSCARPGHAMIERLWPQRMSLADVFIPLGRASGPSFETAARREQARRALRAVAKKAFLAATGRRGV